MSLSDDLLDQAKHLLALDPRRPKQANLRRAISTAYYALFHLLIKDAARLVLAGSGLDDLQPRLRRAFNHGDMKKAAVEFAKGAQTSALPPQINAMLRALPSPPLDLQAVAATFVSLQETRHEADYDTDRRFKRQEVEVLGDDASEAFRAWRRIRRAPLARAFLLTLLVTPKWGRN